MVSLEDMSLLANNAVLKGTTGVRWFFNLKYIDNLITTIVFTFYWNSLEFGNYGYFIMLTNLPIGSLHAVDSMSFKRHKFPRRLAPQVSKQPKFGCPILKGSKLFSHINDFKRQPSNRGLQGTVEWDVCIFRFEWDRQRFPSIDGHFVCKQQ